MLLALILAASPLADANHEYSELNYEACVSKLSRLSSLPSKQRAEGELLLGLCLFALGQEGQARAHVEAALRKDAAVRTPASASPKERAFIDELRASAAEPVKTRRLARKEKEPAPPPKTEPAADAPVVAEAPPPMAEAPPQVAEPPREVPQVAPPVAPAVAAAMPAVVEPAPEKKATWLPFVTGGVALAAAGTGLGFGLSARGLETQGRAEPVQLEAGRLEREGQTHALVANVAFATAGTAAVATVITWLVTR